MGINYVATFKDVTVAVWWYTDKTNKMYIRFRAAKFEVNEILNHTCTVTQFMKGYTQLKFLSKLTPFDQNQYKKIKEIIVNNVIGNPAYNIQQEL